MSILHTVNKSAFSHNTLKSCLSVCQSRDSILLIEDGVFSGILNAPTALQLESARLEGVEIFALFEDIEARGLQEKLAPGITVVDYTGFVQLSIDHNCVQSWY